MKRIKACPICPECGSKKFKRLDDKDSMKVKCLSCDKIIEI